MNILLYIIIFAMGVTFGSFYNLAIYRIPKKIDIIRKRTFCENCGNELRFFEMIPVISYIILGGKCKNCHQKIKKEYVILEILSGLTWILIAYGLNINVYNLEIMSIVRFLFIVLYLIAVFIISGIDKKYKKIERSVLYYGLIVSSLYIIYLCIIGEENIIEYVLYLIMTIVLLIIDSQKQKKEAKESYILQVLLFIMIMIINTGFLITLITIAVVILSITIIKVSYYLKNALNKSKKEKKDISDIYKLGYLFGMTNTVAFIMSLLLI